MYPDVQLFIDGQWTGGADGRSIPVVNPATDEQLGSLAVAGSVDLDRAALSAERAFAVWRDVAPFERSRVMRKAADLLRARAAEVARIMTLEQGKPLDQARAEILGGADTIDWFAEESRRIYGRTIPGRASHIAQIVVMEPIGPVAAFTPWNFPINQAVRKVAAALAAGCSIVLKGPEDTPGSCAELIRAFDDAGVPAGVVNLVFGVPAEVSSFLIAHPAIRKVSFTGSTQVGKQIAALAGEHMKPATMELGGHAPVLVFDDADLDNAARSLVAGKYRNAGQICVAPTRFLVQDGVHDAFVERFVKLAEAIQVGDGLDPATGMGPLAHRRRVEAVETLVADAVRDGAELRLGGRRIGNAGCFFEPTVLTGVPIEAEIMNVEPFGPVALINRFAEPEDALAEANRLPYGLAAYLFTRSAERAATIARSIQSGMVSINHLGLGLPETPFGGVRDSGHGSEGGFEAIEPYLIRKFITTTGFSHQPL